MYFEKIDWTSSIAAFVIIVGGIFILNGTYGNPIGPIRPTPAPEVLPEPEVLPSPDRQYYYNAPIKVTSDPKLDQVLRILKKRNDNPFIIIHPSWYCPGCNILKTKLERLVRKYRSIPVIFLNSDLAPSAMRRYNVREYPTVWHNGKKYHYTEYGKHRFFEQKFEDELLKINAKK